MCLGVYLIAVEKGVRDPVCCCWSDVARGCDGLGTITYAFHSSLVPPAGGMWLGVCWWELMFGKILLLRLIPLVGSGFLHRWLGVWWLGGRNGVLEFM